MTAQLIQIEQIDSFRDVKDFPSDTIIPEVVAKVRVLDEREELEPFLRAILADQNETAHGPAEVVDVLTHKMTVSGEHGLAAFILKGKSFPTVRPKHVSHQIYRLEKIEGLRFSVLGIVGNILDEAKEQFVSTSERLGCAYAILDAGDLARLFVAYGYFCPRDGERIAAGRCQCGYSPKKRLLNILQKQALDELKYSHSLGQKVGLIVLPPGSGKTRIAAEDAKTHKAKQLLYVAHTNEILDVAESEFAAVFGSSSVIRITNRQSIKDNTRVKLGTVQFLKNHLSAIERNMFDYVVVDEFHHAAAKSYKQLIELIGDAFLLGLTATPFRGDRQDITELCRGNVLVNAELRTGIDSGVLAPYHYFGAFDDVDYSAIQHNGITYSVRDMEKALVIPARDHAIIARWREHADQKPTLAFCCSHRHAVRVAQSFREQGIPSEPYLSTTPWNRRRAIVRRLESGKMKVLCVVDVMNEGADIPFIECLLFLRPTESKRIFFQQLGRGLRRFVGKSHCIVIDFIGNFRNAYRIVEFHGLLPEANEQPSSTPSGARTVKELLNLPFGCEVHFDERVIDIFSQQAMNPRFATRHNIGRILLYQYQRLQWRMGRPPTRQEVDRNCWLHSDFYRDVFGSWKNFEHLAIGE
ncbi:MAG: DEAD/DEAH box helicase family protein [Kiritimatiellae bacterium]|nr:DEAD/DEAH box helicase family protein [Kiritimatiellia bacterium]MDD5521769.1 DEAD/DEAH box helicase family protein [Kiritimatiellia bacterium]